jgi:putative restriction endonuclease
VRRAFEKLVGPLPKTTEAECLVAQRVGQNLFRDGLIALWEGRCHVTGLAVPKLLQAILSHGPTARRTLSDSTGY